MMTSRPFGGEKEDQRSVSVVHFRISDARYLEQLYQMFDERFERADEYLVIIIF